MTPLHDYGGQYGASAEAKIYLIDIAKNEAEEKAARLPAMLTVPMIVFILPTLFIVLLGPAVISVMDTMMKH